MRRSRLIVIVLLVALIIAAIFFAVRFTNANSDNDQQAQSQAAQSIPNNTRFAQVKKLSAGQKPVCLAHDPALDDTVKQDDKLPYNKSFGMAIATVILDMPAGYTDVYLHSYSPTAARGYIVFSDKNQQAFVQDLKNFNFDISRKDTSSLWTVNTFIACRPDASER